MPSYKSVCTKCNRKIKHIVVINGDDYGYNCAKSIIEGRGERIPKNFVGNWDERMSMMPQIDFEGARIEHVEKIRRRLIEFFRYHNKHTHSGKRTYNYFIGCIGTLERLGGFNLQEEVGRRDCNNWIVIWEKIKELSLDQVEELYKYTQSKKGWKS